MTSLLFIYNQLYKVCDNVLKDHTVSDVVLFNRAKVRPEPASHLAHSIFVSQGLLVMGAVFKSTEADESDAERRELERSSFPTLPMVVVPNSSFA